MKKLNILLITAFAQTVFSYIPQNGPLTLNDQVQTNQLTFARSIKRGIIMDIIIRDPDFATELTSIHQFLNIPITKTLPSYEEIVDFLQISTNKSGVIATIEAFEKVIMRYLHYNHYTFFIEGKNINIFVAGIKNNWFHASEWINSKAWISSNTSSEITQLMNELEQLANIASKHSTATHTRLTKKIESYRNWKANTLKTIAILGTIGLSIVYRKNISDTCNAIGNKAINTKNGLIALYISTQNGISSMITTSKTGMQNSYQYCATGLQNIGSSIKNYIPNF